MRRTVVGTVFVGGFLLLSGCGAEDGAAPIADAVGGEDALSAAGADAGETQGGACPAACENGGVCEDGACVCSAYFVGPTCGEPDPCTSAPCQHGGTCATDADGAAVCTCPSGYGGPDCGDGSSLQVQLAALYLAPMGDVVWDLELRTPEGAVAWQQRVSSALYGDGKGSASYVGPCFAAAEGPIGLSEVRAWVVGAYDDAILAPGAFNTQVESASAAPVAIVNPTWQDVNGDGIRNAGDVDMPLTRTFECRPNQDVFVQFDAALMQPAQQGFFDIAVNFAGMFCSTKFDCCTDSDHDGACAADGSEDIRLLFTADGVRAPTMVLGFACVGELGGPQPELYFNDVELDCTDPDVASFSADLRLNPALRQGPACTPGPTGLATCDAVTVLGALNPDDVLFQMAVYPGAEQLTSASKLYWNVALGVKQPAIDGCRLRARGTAVDASGAGAVTGGVIPAGLVYPVLTWDVALGTCAEQRLDLVDPQAPVRVDYTSEDGPAVAFGYSLSVAHDPAPF